jgi:hypothetical protein
MLASLGGQPVRRPYHFARVHTILSSDAWFALAAVGDIMFSS